MRSFVQTSSYRGLLLVVAALTALLYATGQTGRREAALRRSIASSLDMRLPDPSWSDVRERIDDMRFRANRYGRVSRAYARLYLATRAAEDARRARGREAAAVRRARKIPPMAPVMAAARERLSG
ncbi:MAG: hypothetical protein IT208_15035 [Chthonomonadales bacterium]|nr:hypothetical protein [Chthonomonadales bacterium]